MRYKNNLQVNSKNHKKPANPSYSMTMACEALHRQALEGKFDSAELIYYAYGINNYYELNYLLNITGYHGIRKTDDKKKNKKDFGKLTDFREYLAAKKQMILGSIKVYELQDKYMYWHGPKWVNEYKDALNEDGGGDD